MADYQNQKQGARQAAAPQRQSATPPRPEDQQLVVATNGALAAVRSDTKPLMEQKPTLETIGVLVQMEQHGLLRPEVMKEAGLIFMSMTDEELQQLKVRDLVRAAEMVVAGKVMGEDFYLVPKVGVVLAVVGVQRELGAMGLPPADLSFRNMTEAERAANLLEDAREIGVICTASWPSLNLQVTGMGTVRLDDMYPGRRYKDYNKGWVTKPESQWVFKPPPAGRSYQWVCAKRAKKDAFQNVRGFVVVTPKQRIEAAEKMGLQIGLTDQQKGFVDAEQAKAAVNQAAIQAVIDQRERELLELMGEAEYAKLVIKRLKVNVEKMRGPETDDPLGIEAEDATEVLVEPAPTAGATLQFAADDFDVDDEDDELPPADLDLLNALRDEQDAAISGNANEGNPATAAQIKLWTDRVTAEIGPEGFALVTCRLDPELDPTAVAAGKWSTSKAAIKSWMRLCLDAKAADYPLTPKGKDTLRLILAEAEAEAARKQPQPESGEPESGE